MRKTLFFNFLVFSVLISNSQELPSYFTIKQSDSIFDTSKCINQNTDLTNIGFELSETAPDNYEFVKLLMYSSIDESFVEAFETFEDFKIFNFGHWMKKNNTFQDNTFIHFKFVVGRDEKLVQTITLCVENLDIVKSRGNSLPEYVKMPIYFATDRNYIDTDDVYDQFGGKRSKLKYGMCEVSIPHDHKIGHIESPSIWKFEFSEDPEKHIVLHKTKLLQKDTFFKTLSENIKKSPKKSSFLFVHGYNVSFGDAAKRTAQISYDLLFEGEAVFYSWPSQANTAAYTRDEANMKWAESNIKKFLEDYITRSDAEQIYLVAHSMGNRGLTRAIISLFKDKPELKENIKEIILAAPDIDADVFKRDIAPQMVELVQKPITLYVSADDIALKASKTLHGYPRAGDSGDGIVLIDGIETIDATGIDTSFLSHSYFADTTSIISDIFDLIKTGKRAKSRQQLKLIELRNAIYWKVKQ